MYMTTIPIDTSRYEARYARLPLESERGSWTFVVDGEILRFFGTYPEACSLVKLYARMHDLACDAIQLDEFGVTGRVRSIA